MDEARAKALEFALLGPHVNLNAEDVVERAKVFEAYLNAPTPAEARPPRLRTGNTQVFVPEGET